MVSDDFAVINAHSTDAHEERVQRTEGDPIPTVTQVVHVCAEHKKPRKLIKYVAEITKEDAQANRRVRSMILIFCNRINNDRFCWLCYSNRIG